MKRKLYEAPAAEVVAVQQQLQLLAGSNPAPNSASFDDYEDGGSIWAREDDFEDFLQDENSKY